MPLPTLAVGLSLLCAACDSERGEHLPPAETPSKEAKENQSTAVDNGTDQEAPQAGTASDPQPPVPAPPAADTKEPAQADQQAQEGQTTGDTATSPPAPPASLRPLTGFAAKVPAGAEAFLAFHQLGEMWQGITRSAFWSEASQLFEDGSLPENLVSRIAPARRLLSREAAMILGDGSAESLRRLIEIGHLNDVAGIRSLGQAIRGGTSLAEPESAAEPPPILGEMDRLLPLLDGWRIPPVTLLFRVENAPGFISSLHLPELPQEAAVSQAGFSGPGGFPFTRIETTLGRQVARLDATILEQLLGKKHDQRLREIAGRISCCLAYGALDASTVAIHLGPDSSALQTLLQDPAGSLADSDKLAFIDPLLDSRLLVLSWTSSELLDATRGHHPVCPLLQAILDFTEEDPATQAVADRLRPDLEALIERAELRHRQPASDHVGIGWRSGSLVHYEATGGLERPGMRLDGASRFHLPRQPRPILSATWVANLEQRRATWSFYGDLVATLAQTTRMLLEAGAAAPSGDGSRGPIGIALGMATLLGPTISEIHAGLHCLYNEALGDDSFFSLDLGERPETSPGSPDHGPPEFPLPRLTMAHSLSNRDKAVAAWQRIEPALEDLLQSIPLPAASARLPLPREQQRDGTTTWSYALPGTAGDSLPGATLSDDLLVLSTAVTTDTLQEIPVTSEQRANDATATEPGFLLALDLAPLSRAAASWLESARDRQASLGTAATLPVDPESLDTALRIARLAEALGTLRLRFHRDAPGAAPRMSLSWNYRDILHTN